MPMVLFYCPLKTLTLNTSRPSLGRQMSHPSCVGWHRARESSACWSLGRVAGTGCRRSGADRRRVGTALRTPLLKIFPFLSDISITHTPPPTHTHTSNSFWFVRLTSTPFRSKLLASLSAAPWLPGTLHLRQEAICVLPFIFVQNLIFPKM